MSWDDSSCMFVFVFRFIYLRAQDGSDLERIFSKVFLNSSPPGQNGRHFADDVVKCIFLNEKFCILIQMSLKFVPLGPIDNKAALVQVIAWRRTVENPLPEPTFTWFTDAYMQHSGRWVLTENIYGDTKLPQMDIILWGHIDDAPMLV